MLRSDHFRRGPPASRLMPHQIRGEVVKMNTVLQRLCFPLKCSPSRFFYVWEKALPYVFKYGNMEMLWGRTVTHTSWTASKYLFVKWQQWRKWSLTLFGFGKHHADWPCLNDYHSSWKGSMSGHKLRHTRDQWDHLLWHLSITLPFAHSPYILCVIFYST